MRNRLLALAAKAVVLVAASAVAVSGVVLASPAEASSPARTAIGGINVLEGTHLQVKYNPDSRGTRPDKDLKITVNPDGTIKIILDKYCLDTWANDGNLDTRTYAYPGDCSFEPSQDFFVVPADKKPTSAPNPDHGAAAEGQWFYLVSKTGKECLSSTEGGLFPNNGYAPHNYAKQAMCDDDDDRQKFRVSNEYWSADAPLRWADLLDSAVKSATKQCGDDSSPENAPCRIRFSNDPGAEWLVPGIGKATELGTEVTQALGCGSDFGGNLPRRTNSTTRDETLVVGSQVQNTHTVTWSIGGEIELSTESSKEQDLVAAKTGAKFKVNGSYVNTSTTSITTSQTVTQTIAPGQTLMNIWNGQALSFTGEWKLSLGWATKNRDQGLAWTIDATSTLPIKDTLTNTARTTNTFKDCRAGDPSVNVDAPRIVTSTQTCDKTDPAPVAAVGDMLSVCPGSWKVGRGTPTPSYRYEWYIVPAGSTTRTPLPNSTGSSLVVASYMKGATLGATVSEEGDLARFASAPVDAPNTAFVATGPGAEPTVFPTGFAGTPRDATVGEAYSQPLVASAGTGMTLAVSEAPDARAAADGEVDLHGLSLGADGVLSGTPTSAGVVTFVVTDTPSNGGPATSSTFTLSINSAPRAVVGDPQLSATVGEPLSVDLVEGDSATDPAELSGDQLPEGLTFDPVTGVLSGAPLQEGVSVIGVRTFSASQTFTITVADVPTALSDQPLPAGTVGVAYSAPLVTSLGTDPLIGRAAVAQAGESAPAFDTDPDAPAGQHRMPTMLGLTIDPSTGVLSGTPTAAGTVRISVVDLAMPSTPAQVKTITIAAAGATTPGTTPAGAATTHLAATGSGALTWGPAGSLTAALVLGAGITVLAATRRRRA
jgi:hypothetical protein